MRVYVGRTLGIILMLVAAVIGSAAIAHYAGPDVAHAQEEMAEP